MMIRTIHPTDDSHWYHLVIGSLILSAWGILALWSASPYAELLSHEEIGEGNLSPLLSLAVFVLGWALMTVAMMLPGSLPLVHRFRRFVLHRPDHNRLVAQFVLGYLAVWMAFGGLAYLGDSVVHVAIERFAPLAAASGGITVAVLLVAGVYQFTPGKRVCLAYCRPSHALLQKDRPEQLSALVVWQLGLRHGLSCLGSCWGLMLLMFAISGMNLGWMLVLAAIMAAERASRWGQWLTRPLGLALIVWAILSLLGFLPIPAA